MSIPSSTLTSLNDESGNFFDIWIFGEEGLSFENELKSSKFLN